MNDLMAYVYAVSRDVAPATLAELRGVGDRPVRDVAGDGLHALVSLVPDDEFGTEALESRLQDLGWLAETARAHHRVVDAAGRAAVVAPLALATVFYDEDRVRTVLVERRDEFTRVLDDLDGRSEWGVKAYLRAAPPSGSGREQATSGTDYLRRRKAAIGQAERVLEAGRESATALHDVASASAVRAHRHRVHDPALTGRSERMVLNGAYLVDRSHTDEWHAAVERAAPDDLTVEITGPWVPYSFADGAAG